MNITKKHKEIQRNAKRREGMRRRAKSVDVLRCVLISFYQDRYRVSPDGETMESIISYVDAKVCNITEEEARDML